MDAEQVIAGRYQIQSLIGRGGMGDVYRALDLETQQLVAVKALKPEIVEDDPGILERFTREGQALAKLNHPNIVKMLAAVEEDGRHYIILEYVPGGSLQEVLKQEGRLAVGRVLEIALDLADALTRAHRLKVIHRDIKPGNVLLAEDGTPRLTDFGVASMGDRSHLTETGALVGTFAYLSPEACRGESLDERTDIWSFGVMLYELLTGENPFRTGQPAATIQSILNDPPKPISGFREDVPPEVTQLIDRMLEKSREKRISSIRQVGADLETLIRGLDTPLRASMGTVVQEIAESDESRFETPSSQGPNPKPIPAAVDGSVIDTPSPHQPPLPPPPPGLPPLPALPSLPRDIQEVLQMAESWGPMRVIENEDGSSAVKVGPIQVVSTAGGSEYVNVGGLVQVIKGMNGHEEVKIGKPSVALCWFLLGLLIAILLGIMICILTVSLIF
jgi:serine/threonine protein kinase